MTAVELVVVGTPKAFWGTEDNTVEQLCEQGGFHLVVGTHGSHEQALGFIGSIKVSSPADKGAGSTEVGSSSASAFFASWASWAFTAHTFLCSFTEDLLMVEGES